MSIFLPQDGVVWEFIYISMDHIPKDEHQKIIILEISGRTHYGQA